MRFNFKALVNGWGYRLIAASIALSSLGVAHGQTLPSQMDDVKFTLEIPSMTPPVKITRVLLDGKLVAMDTPIHVSGNWMGKIIVEVQNISAKEMVYGNLILNFPETGTGRANENSPTITELSDFGQRPASALRRKDGTMRPRPTGELQSPKARVPPGGVVQFAFGPEDAQAAAYRLAGQIHKVEILPYIFYFSDESAWKGGTYLEPAPVPDLWKVAQPDAFLPKDNSVVEFSDFECPYCQRLKGILEQEVLPKAGGKVSISFRNYPLPMHPWAKPAAMMATCAGLQNSGAFWKVHDFIFENQKSLTTGNLSQKVLDFVSSDTAIDKLQYQRCLDKDLALGMVTKDQALGTQNGVRATPTVFVNGVRYEGVQSAVQLLAIINAAADRSSSSSGPPIAKATGGDAPNQCVKPPSG
jgi:protein-disulfide isomerase